MKRQLEDVGGWSREHRDIARRWCVLNAWGWPSDLSMPAENPRDEALRLMARAVRQIGIQRCLTYWNSEQWAEESKSVKRAYGSLVR